MSHSGRGRKYSSPVNYSVKAAAMVPCGPELGLWLTVTAEKQRERWRDMTKKVTRHVSVVAGPPWLLQSGTLEGPGDRKSHSRGGWHHSMGWGPALNTK